MKNCTLLNCILIGIPDCMGFGWWLGSSGLDKVVENSEDFVSSREQRLSFIYTRPKSSPARVTRETSTALKKLLRTDLAERLILVFAVLPSHYFSFT